LHSSLSICSSSKERALESLPGRPGLSASTDDMPRSHISSGTEVQHLHFCLFSEALPLIYES
jgi:hypothetical protein